MKYNLFSKYRPAYATETFCPPEGLEETLSLIQEAVTMERDNEALLNYLISQAPTNQEREIIRGMRNDARKHIRMLSQLYLDLTGNTLPATQEPGFNPPDSYLQGLEQGLFSSLEAVRLYRRILFALQKRKHTNMLLEIITDELIHADLYNFLYTRNRIATLGTL